MSVKWNEAVDPTIEDIQNGRIDADEYLKLISSMKRVEVARLVNMTLFIGLCIIGAIVMCYGAICIEGYINRVSVSICGGLCAYLGAMNFFFNNPERLERDSLIEHLL